MNFHALRSIVSRHKKKLILIAIVAALSLAYPRAEIEFVTISPDDSYRLEHWWPGLLPALYYRHIRDMESPGFVRLYNNHDNTYFGESPVIDFFGGRKTYWPIDDDRTVSIDGEFEYKNVPPTK